LNTNPHLSHLDRLIRRGRELRHTLTADDAAQGSTTAAVRIWQQDCATLVNQLAGGSKAHWLSRAYSQALLVRSSAGRAVEEANMADIVDRIIDVLGRAIAAVSQVEAPEAAASSSEAPPPRRFEFVHDAQLRPILERAFADSRRAFDDGDFRQALVLSCSVLEAVITDALLHREDAGRASADGAIAAWSFETRIVSAERAGLILGGCARLPPVARAYRDLTNDDGELRTEVAVSGRDARLARQVLMVVLRDLDPGR
jgi:hypothetical protein